ncbi:MAG TPA: NUDIX domain-containing protein [Roseiarcus sp.]|jgi:GDP-mannose pyrophosphatase NudK|nr:NUDIX domain-containing protein [Roseiarcus sp.]
MTRAKILNEDVLADRRFKLTLTTIETSEADGEARVLRHEVYHYKHAAALLLYDPARRVVMLVRQFRVGGYLGGAAQPMIEVCAGMLDGDEPETCVIREALEETGIKIVSARHVFDAYTSPGGTTEMIACFVAPYGESDRIGPGGGVDADEHIALLEPALEEAIAMIERGEISDAKTIALLYYAKAERLLDRR